MQGPFVLIRNKWERTPLERIIDALSGVKTHMTEIKQQKIVPLEKINELKKTIETLETEKEKREKKEKRLRKLRTNLIEKLIHQRKFAGLNKNKLKPLLKKIRDIDEDLGPFRSTTFYLD